MERELQRSDLSVVDLAEATKNLARQRISCLRVAPETEITVA